jgi:hypothetical protein
VFARAVRADKTVAGTIRLPLDDVGDVDVSLSVPIEKAQRPVTVKLRARVRASEP